MIASHKYRKMETLGVRSGRLPTLVAETTLSSATEQRLTRGKLFIASTTAAGVLCGSFVLTKSVQHNNTTRIMRVNASSAPNTHTHTRARGYKLRNQS